MPLPPIETREIIPRAIRELSTAMKVVSFYPPRHPSVRVAVDRVMSTLGSVFHREAEVALGLAESGILFQGDYLADADLALKNFAGFLLNRGVARLAFRRGLDADTLTEFLRYAAQEPARLSAEGGAAKYLNARRVTTIEVGEIDLEKFLASEAVATASDLPEPGRDRGTWKKLVAGYLKGSDANPSAGIKAVLGSLTEDTGMLTELLLELASEGGRQLPPLVGRLAEEIRREFPDRLDGFLTRFAEGFMKLDARTRMDLVQHKIPLGDGTADLMERVTRTFTDGMVVEMVSSFIEVEQQLSPRLFAVCSKVFAARGKSAPYFGPITAHLQSRAGADSDLGRIWQSLQGLLVETDQDYLSETYRATLDAISHRAPTVDAELQASLAAAPGYAVAFAADAIADHACRILMGAMDADPDDAKVDSLGEDLERRSRKMTGRARLPVLAEMVHALAEPRPGEIKLPTRSVPDRRARTVMEQMVRAFRGEYERLTEEEKAAANREFRELGGMAAGGLVEALAEEESWEVRKGLLQALSALGPAASPVLLQKLSDPSWFLVRNITLLLGEIGGQTMVEPLAGLLGHEEPRVRREAAGALGKIGGSRAVAHLRQAILDPEVSTVAARALAEIDRENTVALFSRRLERLGRWIRNPGPAREAITVLGEMEAAEATEVLSRILARGFWLPFLAGDTLRIQAAHALRKIGTPAAREAIQQAGRSYRRAVRDTCLALVEAPAATEGIDE